MKQRSLLLKLHNLSSFETNEIKENGASFDTICYENGKSINAIVSNTNAIENTNENLDVIFPFKIEFQSGGSNELPDDIGDDWAMTDDDSSTDFHFIQAITPLGTSQTSDLYSFYFEDTIMNMSDDEKSVSLHDVVSLEDDDYSLETIEGNAEDFWTSAAILKHEISSFSAQVSLSSRTVGEL